MGTRKRIITWELEWEGKGIDYMEMRGSGNVKIESWSSLLGVFLPIRLTVCLLPV